MDYIPCKFRTFPILINYATYFSQYLKWFIHLNNRIGDVNTKEVWDKSFGDYNEKKIHNILDNGWKSIKDNKSAGEIIYEMISEYKFYEEPYLNQIDIVNLILDTPPINLIKQYFGEHTKTKNISAYDAITLRFDGISRIAETMINLFKKEGELIVYDLIIQDRLENINGEQSSVEDFLETFTTPHKEKNLLSAGIEMEVIKKTKNEVVVLIHECEWARFFRDNHPEVGYMIACSTDEIAFKEINKSLHLQRTETLMEGGNNCDFRIFTN